MPDGIPYVRPTEMGDDGIDLAALRRTSEAIASDYARSRLLEGDIILAIVGTIGKPAIVPPRLSGGNITQSSARIRPARPMGGSYIALALQSPVLRAQYSQHEFGNAVRRLNISHVRRLAIPVAPHDEARMVESVLAEALFVTRGLERKLHLMRGNLDRMDSAVLARAFSRRLSAAGSA